MAYQTIEERTALSQQIQELRRWDRIEIITYQRDIYHPLSSSFLKITTASPTLAYFIEANGEKMTVSNSHNVLNTRKRRIPIGKIYRVTALQERVKTQ